MSAVIAGIGCRRDCPSDEIEAVLQKACRMAGRAAGALATASFKSDEPGIRAAASRLGLALVVVSRDALGAAQARCVTMSPVAREAVGFASVAEASALAAAGDGSRLILPRVAHGGATCALALPA